MTMGNKNKHSKFDTKRVVVGFVCAILVLGSVLGAVVPAFAAEGPQSLGPEADRKWVQVDGKWKYKMDNNTYATSAWVKYITDDGEEKWYVDAKGFMVSNDWAKVDGKWYVLGPDGKVAPNTWVQTDNKQWIWSAGDGNLTNGWVTINGKDYHFDSHGVMETGWYQDGNNWYYLNSTGEKVYGWLKLGSDWYYMDSANDGKMATGVRTINGKRYLFDYVSGALR